MDPLAYQEEHCTYHMATMLQLILLKYLTILLHTLQIYRIAESI